jgi:hypothetical protein
MKRALVAALGIGMAVAAAWLIVQFWDSLLFWGYVSVAALLFLINIIGLLALWQRRGPLDPHLVESELIRAQVNRSPLQRFRILTTLVIGNLAECLAWPAAFAAMAVSAAIHRVFQQRIGSLAFFARIKLHPPVTVLSITTAAIVIVVFAADVFLPDEYGHRHTVLFMLVLSVVLRHLGSFMSEYSLSKILRTSLGEPYLKFLAIGTADLISLVLAFAAYQAAVSMEHLGFHHLRGIAVDMFTFAKLREAFTTGTMSWFDALVASAGGLYIATGFKSVVKYQDFSRTVDDLHTIAASQLMTGDYRSARKWLDKIGRPEAHTHELYAATYLAAGDLPNAEHSAATYADEKKVPPATRSSEINRVLMTNVGLVPIPEQQLLGYFAHWLASPASTPFLPAAMESNVRLERVKADDLLKLFVSDDMKQRHTLAYATVLVHAGYNPENLLREHVPGTPAEQIVHFCLLYRCLWGNLLDTLSAESLDALRGHVDGAIDGVRAAGKKLQTDYERTLVIELLCNASELAGSIGLSHRQLLDEVAISFREDIGGDERVLLALRAIDGAIVALRAHLRKRVTDDAEVMQWLRGNAGQA